MLLCYLSKQYPVLPIVVLALFCVYQCYASILAHSNISNSASFLTDRQVKPCCAILTIQVERNEQSEPSYTSAHESLALEEQEHFPYRIMADYAPPCSDETTCFGCFNNPRGCWFEDSVHGGSSQRGVCMPAQSPRYAKQSIKLQQLVVILSRPMCLSRSLPWLQSTQQSSGCLAGRRNPLHMHCRLQKSLLLLAYFAQARKKLRAQHSALRLIRQKGANRSNIGLLRAQQIAKRQRIQWRNDATQVVKDFALGDPRPLAIAIAYFQLP